MVPAPPDPDEDTRHLATNDPPAQDDSWSHFPSVLRTPTTDKEFNLLQRFRNIVCDEITQASRKLSSDLPREIWDIGQRTGDLESCMVDVSTILDAHESDIEQLKAEVELLKGKYEDLENHTHRCNLRLHGLPETVIDLSGTTLALYQ